MHAPVNLRRLGVRPRQFVMRIPVPRAAMGMLAAISGSAGAALAAAGSAGVRSSRGGSLLDRRVNDVVLFAVRASASRSHTGAAGSVTRAAAANRWVISGGGSCRAVSRSASRHAALTCWLNPGKPLASFAKRHVLDQSRVVIP